MSIYLSVCASLFYCVCLFNYAFYSLSVSLLSDVCFRLLYFMFTVTEQQKHAIEIAMTTDDTSIDG